LAKRIAMGKKHGATTGDWLGGRCVQTPLTKWYWWWLTVACDEYVGHNSGETWQRCQMVRRWWGFKVWQRFNGVAHASFSFSSSIFDFCSFHFRFIFWF